MPHPSREKAVRLLKSGRITFAEAAELCGVSRQAVRFWCLVAGVDAVKARQRFLRRLWNSQIVSKKSEA